MAKKKIKLVAATPRLEQKLKGLVNGDYDRPTKLSDSRKKERKEQKIVNPYVESEGSGEYTGDFRVVDASEIVKEKDDDGNEVEKIIPKIKIVSAERVGADSSENTVVIDNHITNFRHSAYTTIDLSDYWDTHYYYGDPPTICAFVFCSAIDQSDAKRWKWLTIPSYSNEDTVYNPSYAALHLGVYCGPWRPHSRDTDKGPVGVLCKIPIATFRMNKDNQISDIQQIFRGGVVSLSIPESGALCEVLGSIGIPDFYRVRALYGFEHLYSDSGGVEDYTSNDIMFLPAYEYGADIPAGTIIFAKSIVTTVYDTNIMRI